MTARARLLSDPGGGAALIFISSGWRSIGPAGSRRAPTHLTIQTVRAGEQDIERAQAVRRGWWGSSRGLLIDQGDR